jgi:tetratricopeptide (TPR) repeat protein
LFYIALNEREKRIGSAKISLNEGIIYKNKGKVDEALKIMKIALKTNVEMNYIEGQAITLRNICYCCDDFKQFEAAIPYSEREIQIVTKLKDFDRMVEILWENVLRYEHILKYEEAKSLCLKYKLEASKHGVFDEDKYTAKITEIEEKRKLIFKLAPLSAKIENIKDLKILHNLYEERGKIYLDLKRGNLAQNDFKAHKIIGEKLKLDNSKLCKSLLYMGESNYICGDKKSALHNLKTGLQYLPESTSDAELYKWKKLYFDCVYFQDSANYPFLQKILDESLMLAQRMADLQKQHDIVQLKIEIAKSFGRNQDLSWFLPQLKRITKEMGSDCPNEFDIVYCANIE